MDSFVEAQNSLKRMSDGGCVTLFKAQQSHAVRFSFIPVVHEVTGLKTYRGPKRKEQLGCVILIWPLCAQQRTFHEAVTSRLGRAHQRNQSVIRNSRLRPGDAFLQAHFGGPQPSSVKNRGNADTSSARPIAHCSSRVRSPTPFKAGQLVLERQQLSQFGGQLSIRHAESNPPSGNGFRIGTLTIDRR